MNTGRLRGFTLVELLVVIAIIGTLVGMLLPAVQAAREASRASACTVNLTQLQKALQSYEDSVGNYPGYVEPLGLDQTRMKGVSWVVTILPYIEQRALYETWITTKSGPGKAAYLNIAVCPSNPRTTEGAPALSYVGNAGSLDNEPKDICEHRVEHIGNGVFFDRTRGLGNDQREQSPDCLTQLQDPILKMSLAYIQSGDGSTCTLLLSESLRTITWAGQPGYDMDRKWNYGFCWSQPDSVRKGLEEDDDRQYFRINGIRESSGYGSLSEMQPSDAFPSSNHPGGVNVAFAAGNVRLLHEKISPMVYAQLMTTNRKASELMRLNNRDDPVLEKELDQPTDDDY